MRPALKRLCLAALGALALAIGLAVADYLFFYRPHVEQLRGKRSSIVASVADPWRQPLPEVRHVEPPAMRRLGKLNTRKQSAFIHFDREKAPGVVRTCSFGDSFTQGGEVDDVHDYPNLLERRFAEAGAGNVESINFGIGAFGLSQSYMLWDFVARGFDCDFVLLGPRGFQSLRDATFGVLYHWTPFYLHARYVLDGGDVRLVEVAGDTYGERFDDYFRFLPRWRYLRYCRNPPLFLKTLLPEEKGLIAAGQRLENPFYYDRREAAEEVRDIHRILLGKLAGDGPTVLLGHYWPRVVELGESIEQERLSAVSFPQMLTFPYLAPQSHAGPFGNQLNAELFFAQLTGSREPIPILSTRNLEGAESEAPRRSLSSYTKVTLELAGVPIGRFTLSAISGEEPLGVDGLLSFHGEGESLLDGCLLPVDLELQPGMEVALRIGAAPGTAQHRLGEVAVSPGGFNIGAVRAKGIDFLTLQKLEHLREHGVPWPLTGGKRRPFGIFFRGNEELAIDGLPEGSELAVLVDGQPVLRGELGAHGETPGIWLDALGDRCRFARANSSGLVGFDTLEDSGVIEIVAEHWQDGTVRAPLAAWTKAWIDVPRAERAAATSLALTPQGAVIQP